MSIDHFIDTLVLLFIPEKYEQLVLTNSLVENLIMVMTLNCLNKTIKRLKFYTILESSYVQ